MPVSAYEQHQRTRASADSEEKPPKAPKKKAARKKRVAKKAVAKKKAPKKKAAKPGDGKHRISAWVTMEQTKAIADHGGIDGMLAGLKKLGGRVASLEGALEAGENFAEISRLLEGGGIFLAWKLSTGQLVLNPAPNSPEEIRMFLNRCTLSPEDAEKSGDRREVISGFQTDAAGMRFLPVEGERFLGGLEKIASAWFDFNDCGAVLGEEPQKIEERDSLAAEVKSRRGEKESEIAALRAEMEAERRDFLEEREGLLVAAERYRAEIQGLKENVDYWEAHGGLIRNHDRQEEITAEKRDEGFRMNEFHPQDYRGALRRVAAQLEKDK